MNHSTFIYSSTEECLGCFQVLAIMNKTAVNIRVCFLHEHKFSIPLGKEQGAWLLNCLVWECLVLYHLHSYHSEWEFMLLHILTSARCCLCLDLGDSNRCSSISLLFNLQFHNDMILSIFQMLICHLYVFFGKVSVQVFFFIFLN